MQRLFGLTLAAATVALSAAAIAAPEHLRIRGTVASVSGDTMTVHTTTGEDLPIALGSDTKYLSVVKASLDNVETGSFIGTATKNVGSTEVALEVVVFPPAMRGAGEGHYPWDKLPDTTLSGGAKTASTMTNGNVSAVSAPSDTPAVNTSMTNGDVATATSANGAKKLTVTYKGGEQTIVVPPTAPVVTFKPGAMADVAKDATVFVIVTKDEGKETADVVAIGTDGVKPPM
jgi:hypothetical protein